jgi:hypothetical protein
MFPMNGSLTFSNRPKKQRSAVPYPQVELVRTKNDIVNLSLAQIRDMSREELIALIRLADVPLLHGGAMEHLPYSDWATLERLAFLAQRMLRNQGDHNDRPEK